MGLLHRVGLHAVVVTLVGGAEELGATPSVAGI